MSAHHYDLSDELYDLFLRSKKDNIRVDILKMKMTP